MSVFENVKKNFGFGCMRLPMLENDEVDYDHFSKMIDTFMAEGFNYFDTAHGYISGKSEIAIRECLAKRYDRESYILTNKLSEGYFQKEEDIVPFFESQLEACGVEYFDFYLFHAINKKYYKKYTECNAFEVVKKLKEQGKVRHIGMSFHDKAEVLDMILSEHPEIETVQIQFNYLDYEDVGVEGRLCYEVCRKYNKPIIVMEPVRGGALVNLPDKAKSVLEALEGGSIASYAIRYAAGFEGMFMTLSGMSNMEQMNDNLSYMKNFVPLNEREHKAVSTVCAILKNEDAIPCTACSYCVDGCPMNIAIPDLFSCYNSKKQHEDYNGGWYYYLYTLDKGKAKDCIGCGACEEICPQKINIREQLKAVSEIFDK